MERLALLCSILPMFMVFAVLSTLFSRINGKPLDLINTLNRLAYAAEQFLFNLI